MYISAKAAVRARSLRTPRRQGLGIEVDVAGLRNAQMQVADARVQRLVLETVGMALPLVGPLVRCRA